MSCVYRENDFGALTRSLVKSAIFVNIAENGEVFQLMVEFRDDQTLMYFRVV